jgi:hypothetical protein
MSRAKVTGLPMRQALEAIEGRGLGSHGERLSARPPSLVVGFCRAGGQRHDELESKFVVATQVVSSLPITNALPKAVRGRYRRLTARALDLWRILG